MSAAGLLLLAAGLGAGDAAAAGPEVWAALHDARLAESADRDAAAAVAVYETLLHHLPAGDTLEAELLLQLARARFDDGDVEAAREALARAGDDPALGARVRAWRVQLDAWERRVISVGPLSLDPEESPLVLGSGAAADAGLTSLDGALAWDTNVRDGRDDYVLAAIDPTAAPVEGLRLVIGAESFPAHLRVIVEDRHGQRWATPVSVVRPGSAATMDLDMAELLPAAALAGEGEVDPAEVRVVLLQDVTAFHSGERGRNRLRIEAFVLR